VGAQNVDVVRDGDCAEDTDGPEVDGGRAACEDGQHLVNWDG